MSAEFLCVDFGRKFGKKVGVSQHRGKVHAIKYHEEAKEELQGKVPVKKRWTDVESSNLALIEERLLNGNFKRNINQEILKQFESR